MLTIRIDEEFKNEDDIAIALHLISRMVKDGYESSYDPSWAIEEVDEDLSEYDKE